MAALLDAVVSWPTFLIALIVFGFAPGAVLRLIVLAFERDDPRRQELRAEVYAVPRWERPFWVFQTLEVALFDGLLPRIVWAATGRVFNRWHLGDGVARNREHPNTFEIPDETDKNAIEPGVLVKLMFEQKREPGERMWVRVEQVRRRHIVGTLQNLPVFIPHLEPGDKIKFKREHIIDIVWDDIEEDADAA